MDKIIVQDCSFQCKIGVSDEEKLQRREIFVDVEMFYDLKKSGETDELCHTINYSEVHSILKDVVEEREYNLIEALAEKISSEILEKIAVDRLIVRVKKPLPKKKMKKSCNHKIIKKQNKKQL